MERKIWTLWKEIYPYRIRSLELSYADNWTTEPLNGVIKCSVVHRGESWETL